MEKGGRGSQGGAQCARPAVTDLRGESPDKVDTPAVARACFRLSLVPLADERLPQVAITALKVSAAALKQAHRHRLQAENRPQLLHCALDRSIRLQQLNLRKHHGSRSALRFFCNRRTWRHRCSQLFLQCDRVKIFHNILRLKQNVAETVSTATSSSNA